MKKPKIMKKFMGKMKQKHQNLSRDYICENCGTEVEAPIHCEHAMHLANKKDGDHWICWMGSMCGDEVIPRCCDDMKLKIVK